MTALWLTGNYTNAECGGSGVANGYDFIFTTTVLVYTLNRGRKWQWHHCPGGWVFNHWSGDASCTAASTNVTMNSNKVVTAYFAPQGITLIRNIKQDPALYDRV